MSEQPTPTHLAGLHGDLWQWVVDAGGEVTDVALAAERALPLVDARDALIAFTHTHSCRMTVHTDGRIGFRFHVDVDAASAQASLQADDSWAQAQRSRLARAGIWDALLRWGVSGLGVLAYWWHCTFEEAYDLTWCRAHAGLCVRANATHGHPSVSDFVLSGVLSGLTLFMVALGVVAVSVAIAPLANWIGPAVARAVISFSDRIYGHIGPVTLPLVDTVAVDRHRRGAPSSRRSLAADPTGPFAPVITAQVGWQHATMDDVWWWVAHNKGVVTAEEVAALTAWPGDKVDAALTTMLVHGGGDIAVTDTAEIQYTITNYQARDHSAVTWAWQRLLPGAGDQGASSQPVVEGWLRAMGPSLAVALCWAVFPFAEADAHVVAPRWMPSWLWFAAAAGGVSAMWSAVQLLRIRVAHGRLVGLATRAQLLGQVVERGWLRTDDAPPRPLAEFVEAMAGEPTASGFRFPWAARLRRKVHARWAE